MPTVFISHSTREPQVVAMFARDLQQIGVRSIVSEWSPEPGKPIAEKIENQISMSDCVLALLTRSGARSPSVNQEIGYAKGKKPIIPVVEKGTKVGVLLQGLEYIIFDRAKPHSAVNQVTDFVQRFGLQKELARAISNSVRLFLFQEEAVDKATDAILNGKKRVLITMATGTGKTLVTFHLLWRLYKSGVVRHALYVTDRDILLDQIYAMFDPFGEARAVIGEKIQKNKIIYFSTYQSLSKIYQKYKSTFFDMVVLDECRRFKNYRNILQYFSNAVHLGISAVPDKDTQVYFGKPIYVYSIEELKQRITRNTARSS